MSESVTLIFGGTKLRANGQTKCYCLFLVFFLVNKESLEGLFLFSFLVVFLECKGWVWLWVKLSNTELGPLEAQIQRILGQLSYPKKIDKDTENNEVGILVAHMAVTRKTTKPTKNINYTKICTVRFSTLLSLLPDSYITSLSPFSFL